jgi:phosphate:Na+ symporter
MSRLWHDQKMSLSMILITILSAICLLLWGLRMVKRAILRGFGNEIQSVIAKGTTNRFMAALSGFFVTLFLQSSTATALLASSFVGRGLMTVAAGLAVMIGADIGTALVAKILSLKMEWVAPMLLFIGITWHLTIDSGAGRTRHIARILIGLGFMLMALGIIREATIPMAESETLPLILRPLESEPILAMLIAAIITYVMHSSVSAILLFATLAGSGVLPLDLAFYFVIGANFGVSLIPLFAVMRDTPAAVQVPLGNLVMRFIMGLIALFLMPHIFPHIVDIDYDVAGKVILAHIGFNTLILITFLPFVGTLAKLCHRLRPGIDEDHERRERPRFLDKKALSTPSVALSCATRETLNLSEIIEGMLTDSMTGLEKNDEDIIQAVKEKDNSVDRLYAAIKTYLIDLSSEELKPKEAEQCMYIMNFAMNLEHCGDIIEKSLMEIAAQKAKQKDNFSEEGMKEIKSFHRKVVKNLQLAQSIFLSNDPILAKQLIDYKKGLKMAEQETAASHLKRLQQRLPDTIATSSIHMDVIRDLRRINTYVTSVAYSILEASTQKAE